MNVAQMDKLAQSAAGENRCGSCGRPLFGLVAHCPYCGREPRFTPINQASDDRPQVDELDKEPRLEPRFRSINEAPDDRLQVDELDKEPMREPRFTPTDQAPGDRPPDTAPRGTLLFKTAVIGVGALLLLLWMGEQLRKEGASAQTTMSTSDIASTGAGRSTSAAPLPLIPPRTEAAVPPPSNNSLCSVASEAAGLCKSQN
jgi:hypothetical protein